MEDDRRRAGGGDDHLDDELAWDAAGHLSELGVAAVADGELALLSERALLHADSCAACAAEIGRVALSSLALAETLAASGVIRPVVAALPAVVSASTIGRAPARRPVPMGLVVGALIVAVLGLVPSAGTIAATCARLPRLFERASPPLARGLALLFHRLWQSPTFTMVAWASAVALVLVGVAIARIDAHGGRPLQQAEKGAW